VLNSEVCQSILVEIEFIDMLEMSDFVDDLLKPVIVNCAKLHR
jgi:hypothetical protein